jgi:transposase
MQFLALEDMIEPESWARVIDTFVDTLPLKDWGFQHASLQAEGRPPYDPAVLLKLYLYGYKHAIRSSRKLEHACRVNIELWWLLKGVRPSFRSIAYFRKENSIGIKCAFRYFVVLLQELEMIEGETIGIDSFKIRAQNSVRNNFTQAKIDRHINFIDNKIEEYEQRLQQADAIESKEIKAKIAERRKKRKEYEAVEQTLVESGDSQVSITDKDARMMHLGNNGTEISYCIQAATDKKHKLFVHADIGALDKRQLAPMALAVKQLLDLRAFNSLSDAGYSSSDQLQICKSAGIITYSAPMPTTAPSYNCIPTSEFVYDKQRDCNICPAGNVLNKVGNYTRRNTYKAFMYKPPACETCSIRQECTKNKMGRIIERTEYQNVIDENKERVRKNKDYYKLRQQIVEHQFGILKRQWGFSFTLMRGKQNVLSEVYLLMIAYNLKNIISVLGGVKAFSQRLKDFVALAFMLFTHIGRALPAILKMWKMICAPTLSNNNLLLQYK